MSRIHRYFVSLALTLVVASKVASAVPAYNIRTVGPTGYSSILIDLASNGVSGGAATTDFFDSYGWINSNGIAQILPGAAAVTMVNSAGHAVGFLTSGNGFFFDGTNVVDLGELQPLFLSPNDVVGGLTSTGSGLWKGGPLIDLGYQSQILAMNSTGDVVGVYDDGFGYYRAFSHIGDTLTDLHPVFAGEPESDPDSSATGINDAGAITGINYNYCSCTEAAGFTYISGNLTQIPFASQTSLLVNPHSISNSGLVTGDADFDINGNLFQHAFKYDANSDTEITDLNPGEEDTFYADAANEAGHVAGSNYYGDRVFLHRNGVTTYYDAYGLVTRLNIAGDLIGDDGYDPTSSFVILDGSLYTLNSLNPDGSPFEFLSFADGLNDLGQLGGTGLIEGVHQAFILDPVPEPGAMALTALGGAVLLAWRRRKARV